MTIPYDFISSHCKLTWSEIQTGKNKGLISEADIVRYAADTLQLDSCSAQYELSNLQEGDYYQIDEKITVILEIMQNYLGRSNVWLCLSLMWLYENRSQHNDPLQRVEEIYADFDYPSEIEGFIRYMPVQDGYDPSARSHEENEQRLLKKWREYLSSCCIENY